MFKTGKKNGLACKYQAVSKLVYFQNLQKCYYLKALAAHFQNLQVTEIPKVYKVYIFWEGHIFF